MSSRLPLNDLISHLDSAGDALEVLLSDAQVLTRLAPGEVDHLAAALESVMHAWRCLEHVGGIGPAVPGVKPLAGLLPPTEDLPLASVLVN
jgi:hypothetical protein